MKLMISLNHVYALLRIARVLQRLRQVLLLRVLMAKSDKPVSGMNRIPSIIYSLLFALVRRAIYAPPLVFDPFARLSIDSRLLMISAIEALYYQCTRLQKFGKDVFVRRRSSLKMSNMKMMFEIASITRAPSFQENQYLRCGGGRRSSSPSSPSSHGDRCRGIYEDLEGAISTFEWCVP